MRSSLRTSKTVNRKRRLWAARACTDLNTLRQFIVQFPKKDYGRYLLRYTKYIYVYIVHLYVIIIIYINILFVWEIWRNLCFSALSRVQGGFFKRHGKGKDDSLTSSISLYPFSLFLFFIIRNYLSFIKILFIYPFSLSYPTACCSWIIKYRKYR